MHPTHMVSNSFANGVYALLNDVQARRIGEGDWRISSLDNLCIHSSRSEALFLPPRLNCQACSSAENEGVKTDKLVKELQKVIQKDMKQLEKEGTEITKQQKEMLLAMNDNIEIMVKATGMFACNGFGVESLDKTQGV